MSRSSFLDLVTSRASVRRYDPDRPVSDGHLAAILEAARTAGYSYGDLILRVVDEARARAGDVHRGTRSRAGL